MIAIIDYDAGNIKSVEKALKLLGQEAVVTRDHETILGADRVILPGVGAFGDAMGKLEQFGLDKVIHEVVRKNTPFLGICLGHQAICKACGATVSYAKRLMHGKQSETVFSRECVLFGGCPDTAPVARYHSLAVLEETLPECLMVTARTQDGEIMAVQHRHNPVYGLQFHPESILTPDGKTMLTNFLSISYNNQSKKG